MTATRDGRLARGACPGRILKLVEARPGSGLWDVRGTQDPKTPSVDGRLTQIAPMKLFVCEQVRTRANGPEYGRIGSGRGFAGVRGCSVLKH